MKKYNCKKIEKKWQDKWDRSRIYYAQDFSKKPKYYCLIEFPYPSGAGLHVGHLRSHIAIDIVARKKRMGGYNVMYPIGWDAFGLPTENFAIKTKTHPKIVTKNNIKNYTRQIKSYGPSFDWSREINTTDPKYYKWTQWIFLKLFNSFYDQKLDKARDIKELEIPKDLSEDKKREFIDSHRLAYEAEMAINWCPSCKIGLANEEVINGACERCGAPAEKKIMKQWMLRITKYAERLIKNLETVDYLDKIKTQQINWIGRSEGAIVKFQIQKKETLCLIIHGSKDTDERKHPNYIPENKNDWFLWTKEQLEKNSIKTYTPLMPSSWQPDYKNWKKQIEKLNLKIDENSILIGHSAGGSFIVRWLGEKQVKINKLILIAPSKSISDENGRLKNLNDFDTDKNIKNLANEIIVFSSRDDKPYRIKNHKIYKKELDAKFIEFRDKGHFTFKYMKSNKFPELLEEILKDNTKTPEHSSEVFREPESNPSRHKIHSLEVFTTRPDTLFGCTYMVIAPEHPLIKNLESGILNLEEVKKYIEQAKNKSDLDRTDLAKEKTGVELKGIKAINPANNEEIPIWVADYVLISYGTGAIMAVPAHDERDFEFAKKFGIKINEVVVPIFKARTGKDVLRPDKKTVHRKIVVAFLKHWKENKFLCLDWKKHDWHSGIIGGVEKNESLKEAAMREIQEETGYKNLKFVRYLGSEQHNTFFAAHKDENRYSIERGLFFELKNDEREKPSEEETKNHDAVWIDANKMDDFLNLDNQRSLWRRLNGEIECFKNDGVNINSDFLNGLETPDAKKEIIKWLEKNKLGKKAINYKLRDWIFSRQHYWGEPIPIVKCDKCGNVPLNKKDLPLKLPNVKNYEPTDTGESPLANINKWVNIKCPKCKGNAKRETDTMPNWAGSSWYFLRYTDPNNDKEFASKKNLKKWMPVDLYNGGMEHTTLHLLYSRFWHKFLFDLNYTQTAEPYKMRRSHGMVLAEDGQKMSKSRGNVVNPDEVIGEYGADTVRLYEMFMGPYGDAIPWNTTSLIGMNRFLERVWGMQSKVETRFIASKAMETLLHQTIKKVTEDIENLKFNTAISQIMILTNEMDKQDKISITTYQLLLTILSPFAPHITEELWETLENKESIHLQSWPEYNSKLLIDSEITLVLQINGKLRDQIKVPVNISEEEAKKLALESEKIKKWIEKKEIRKIIFVKGRLVNIVI